MTVCIATLSFGTIFGVADRMLTAGDVEYEPATQKIFPLTNSIVVMTAGDSSFQAEIIFDLRQTISNVIKKNPQKWLDVKEVAYLYTVTHNSIKQKRAENYVLIPIGLNNVSFITRQKEMSSEFIDKITRKMLDFEVPPVEAIITGVDEAGSHIYVIGGDSVSCWDTIGFASIGIGSRHAGSQLMLARHSPLSSVTETLLLAYTSKKRSEISPGIGKATDMFMIGPQPGSYTILVNEVITKLEKTYNNLAKKEETALNKAKEEMELYVRKLQAKAASSQIQTVKDGGEAPVDGTTISIDAKKDWS